MAKRLFFLGICFLLAGCATCDTRLQSHQKWLSENKLYSIYQEFRPIQSYDIDCNLKHTAKIMIERGYPYFVVERTGLNVVVINEDEKIFVRGHGVTSAGYKTYPEGKGFSDIQFPVGKIFDSNKIFEEISNKYDTGACKGDRQYRECR